MRVALWVVFGLCVVAVAIGSLTPGALRWLPWYYPQWTHVVVYAGVAALFHAGLGRGSISLWRTVVLVGLLGLGMELSQMLVPGREADLEDALLNVLGALAGAGAVEVFQRFRRRGESQPQASGETAATSQAQSAAEQVSQLSEDRLIPAWAMLQRRGLISPAVAALAQRIDAASTPIGNAPETDRALLEAFAEQGVRCLLLKGTLLAHCVYDAPSQRARGDTDVLVAPADRGAAEQVLRGLGLARSWSVTAKTSDTQDQWQGAIDGRQAVVDLHWQLLNHPAFSELFEFEACWARRQVVRVAGFEAAGLGNADALLHAALHYFAHHGDEFRPAQWLLDGDLLWRAMDDGERKSLIESARDKGVSGLLHAYCRACIRRFETPMASGWLQTLESTGRDEWRTRLLTVQGKPVRELLFMLRARPDWKSRLAHLRALLLPSRAYMRTKYPDARRWALPWLYLRRMVEGRKK